MTEQPNTPEESDEKKDVYDVFDDIRGSLAEDDDQDEQPSGRKKKGFLKSLKGKRSKKSAEEKDDDDASDEADEPAEEPADGDAELEERLAEEYLAEAEALMDEADELLDDELLLAELEEAEAEAESEAEEAEPAPRLSETLETDADHIRDIALEDYTDEELEKVDDRKKAVKEFFQAPTTRMRKSEWIVIAFIGLLVGGFIFWLGIQANGGLRPEAEPLPTFTPNPDIPTPTMVELPGGWKFPLGKGSLDEDGQWNPSGAEWLQGTEICKWVALPSSTQLEAVIRTLEAGDEVKVTMSNYDVLTYHVYSRQQVTAVQSEELNLDTPSLLVILFSKEEADSKWVLTSVLDYESAK